MKNNNIYDLEPNEMMPVLLAVECDDKGNWAVWCPYCRHWHIHGGEEGHRVAHCDKRSPFKKTGYYIKKLEIPKKGSVRFKNQPLKIKGLPSVLIEEEDLQN